MLHVSGKSTLSNLLLQYLGKRWKLIEFDVIEENIKLKKVDNDRCDDKVINELVNESNNALKTNNIIIDTNVYDEKLTSVKCDFKKFIFVYYPLNILYQRNQKRDNDLKRDAQKAEGARNYVEETFNNFQQIPYDMSIDSSKMTLEDSCVQIINILNENKKS